MKAPLKDKLQSPDPEQCFARSVANTLAEEPTLEAVTIDAAHERISLATLGRTDVDQLAARLTTKLHNAKNADLNHACPLLSGKAECAVCGSPLSAQDLKRITIRQEGDAMTIARVTCPTAPKFWRWREIPFPKIAPRQIEVHDDEHHADEWKWQLVAAILCGALGLAGVAAPDSVKVFFYAAAYVAGGFFPAEEVWERLHKRTIDVHFLMLAVAVGAASVGAWGEGATLLFLFSLSGGLEHYALGRTQKEIRSLFRDAPKTATVLDDKNHEQEMPVEYLRAGMRLLIKPGAQFPVDAEISKGETAADESNLTGEASPVEKSIGDTALAGTMNLWGAVEVLVLRPAAESALQKIITLIREAQQQKAPSQRFADQFSTGYTYCVLALSLTMFFVWWLAYHLTPFHSAGGIHSAFYRAMTLLVVSSPCALVLSIPSAVLAAIASGARHGILFRGGAAVEKLATVTAVALDKTGTLTTGELRVETVESFPAGREDEVARAAYSLEKLSSHPLARAITRHGKHHALTTLPFDQFESITGQGLRAKLNSTEYRLGRREWVAKELVTGGIRNQTEHARALPGPANPGMSEVWVAGGDLLGRVVLRDDIRAQARSVVDELRAEKLSTIVLTGDRQETADFLREQLKLDDIRAAMRPEQKVEVIRELTAQGKRVAMVGDGVNDAPSLAAAYIGVAMGARGADAALEQADVVLMHDRLENFLAAFRLSQRARAVIHQNLFISLGTIVVLVAMAMGGKIPLTIGVVGHEGSTVVVVMNSLRLLLDGSRKH